MPVAAVILLLLSASLHALWNLLLKRTQEKYIAMGWQVILSGIFAFLLLFFTGLPPRSMWLFVLISMTLEAVYFILLSNAYSDHDFSLVYPIARGTAPAFLMLWSILFLEGGCPLTMVGLEIGRKALFRRSHMGAVIERSLISTQLMHVAMDIDGERFLDLLITRLAGQ